jgi:FkbH-like protein
LPVQLHWLPNPTASWRSDVASLIIDSDDDDHRWERLVALSNQRIDYAQTVRLDKVLQDLFKSSPPAGLATKPVKLAVLASSTAAHLIPGIRIGALRRNMWVQIYECAYGQYLQELSDVESSLWQFRPNVVLLSLDARHLLGGNDASVTAALHLITDCWRKAQRLGCTVIQQTVLPVLPPLLGNNEHKLKESPQWNLQQLNFKLRELAGEYGVHLLAIDQHAAIDGLREWHDFALWNRSKQEIHPSAAAVYGDLVGRMLAAEQGRSYKCLVLDLDNTLWGGVIGDDGLAGIVLGQGHAVGEAFVAFQRYARDLSQRGVILAVCSKNDETNALAPFTDHPEMLLKRDQIACFVANWTDKASNLRTIAQTLNIGIDSLVFIDDNPLERSLIRKELPTVAVPELPEDPSLYVTCLSEAGYFEALSISDEDRERSGQYQANLEREQIRQSATDMEGFLSTLQMQLMWKSFDQLGLTRIVQLINKTNQFNLTTKRYAELEVAAMIADPCTLTFQFRLKDRFGDNGIIAIVIGRSSSDGVLVLDTWLMSCRVLGRRVEETTLNAVVSCARSRGIRKLVGVYRPTAKNGMVREHYSKLGFEPAEEHPDGPSLWNLDLESFEVTTTCIEVSQG